jgi:hypothetical protein
LQRDKDNLGLEWQQRRRPEGSGKEPGKLGDLAWIGDHGVTKEMGRIAGP